MHEIFKLWGKASLVNNNKKTLLKLICDQTHILSFFRTSLQNIYILFTNKIFKCYATVALLFKHHFSYVSFKNTVCSFFFTVNVRKKDFTVRKLTAKCVTVRASVLFFSVFGIYTKKIIVLPKVSICRTWAQLMEYKHSWHS